MEYLWKFKNFLFGDPGFVEVPWEGPGLFWIETKQHTALMTEPWAFTSWDLGS